MTNPLADKQAFPRSSQSSNEETIDIPGMSLRTYIATAALQGLLANSRLLTAWEGEKESEYCERMSRVAIAHADKLLAELAKEAK